MISPDLIEEVRSATRRMMGSTQGQCYRASEALYILAGGKAAGITPMYVCNDERSESHWFLRDEDGTFVDVTGDQAGLEQFDFEQAVGCGFQRTSNGARDIMAEVRRQRRRR